MNFAVKIISLCSILLSFCLGASQAFVPHMPKLQTAVSTGQTAHLQQVMNKLDAASAALHEALTDTKQFAATAGAQTAKCLRSVIVELEKAEKNLTVARSRCLLPRK